jgi:predicted site-specific integrase-resolvase
MNGTPSTPTDRPGVTYAQARAILAELGIVRSLKTIKRWAYAGILNVKRVTHGTVILYRDEVEALAKKEDPWD